MRSDDVYRGDPRHKDLKVIWQCACKWDGIGTKLVRARGGERRAALVTWNARPRR